MSSIVELQQVEKKYLQVQALHSLDLSLQQGEVLGLFGHNGAGKTTIIKLILGLIEPTSGEVRVFGESPSHGMALQIRSQLGFLQENVSFYDQLTGLEVLNYFASLKRVSKKKSMQLLVQVGLQDACKRKVKTYSKGMRQRLGLAQALLGNPKLLLLDEPTVGLDPIATQDFYLSIEQLKQQGCTVVLCSHVLPGVEKYIDRALIMGSGELLASGSLAQLRLQASLPAQFTLQGNSLTWPTQALAASVKPGPLAGQYQLEVAMEQKMHVLKQLISQPGLQDLQVSLPSLEDLYRHFIQVQGKSEVFL
ncbi:MAG: copper ABC transporter ATP-binding protein [Osedax symbiont Rs2]|nr:MAG: copper ABC transporter ATP-binding protein [Osedax symbiont Rs2]